ncbi:hypothetical protein FACS1894124_3790 [Spirochaetia bacterium]|nr:hypothetical protein FACS1894124_3790 [Spirochaetia bacterium]
MSASAAITAPCKINLHLKIGGRRSDGYHDLLSVFAGLDFGDTLWFDEGERGDSSCHIEMIGGNPSMAADLPLERNIIVRAAALFRECTGYDRALRVRLEKRIPLGGGLGGGSSDAASTLMALDALAGTALSRERLTAMAEILGSDVPFFLCGGMALVTGRGEGIRPLPMPKMPIWVVLVNPGFASGTAEAFALLDAARGQALPSALPGGRGAVLPEAGSFYEATGELSGEALAAALGDHPASWPYGNDFLPVFLADRERGDVYEDMLTGLNSLGADFSGLSGAGATCFGVFSRQGAAEAAVRVLKKRWNFVCLTFFLARSATSVLQ